MPEQKSHISVVQGFEVQRPAKGKAYLIPLLEWEHLKEKINKIETNISGFHTAGSLLLGIAATAFVGALSIPKDSTMLGTPSVHICWGIFVTAMTCGIMALYFASRQRKSVSYEKRDVLTEMAQIEKRYGKTEQSQNQIS